MRAPAAALPEAAPVLHPRDTLRHAVYVLSSSGAPDAAVVDDDGACPGLLGPADLLVARLHDLTEATAPNRPLRYLTPARPSGARNAS